MKHLMPPLPYAPSALAPLLSEETIQYHYGKHLQTYVDNLNKLAEGTPYADMCLELIITTAPEGALRNNAAQVWNHTFYFDGLTPAPKTIPAGLQKQLCADFGSVEAFRAALQTAAAGLFGSGWTWLVLDADCHLRVLPLSNAGNPLRLGLQPLLTLDVWEHAYYIDYRNRRADYLEALWQLTDWERVASLSQRPPVGLYY